MCKIDALQNIEGEIMSHHIDTLQLKVAKLSRKTHELGIPVMIILKGYPRLVRHVYQMIYYFN